MASSVIYSSLFIFLFLISSSTSSLFGDSSSSSSLCTRGPGYWCKDAETARICDATKYCNLKVWKNGAPESADASTSSSSSSSSSTVSSVPMIPIMDKAVESVPMIAIGQEAEALPSSSSSSTTASTDLCTYCEEVVNYAKILLGNPDAEKEIETLLTGMCAQLGPLKDSCVEYIQENIGKIVHTIAHLDTKEVCVTLHMCSEDGKTGSSSTMTSFTMSPLLAPLRPSICAKCRSFSSNLLEGLQSSTDALPKRAVDYCHRLGRDDLLCHHHLGVFLASAKVVGSPDYFCDAICKDEGPMMSCGRKEKSTTTTTTTTTTSPNPQPPACSQCIEALKTMKSDLSDKLACLEEKLKNYCNAFPPLAEECKSAVDGFFKPLHEQIDGLDPMTLCIQIGVCNPSSFRAHANANLCVTCEQTVNYAKILVGEPGVEAQVEQLLLNLCQNLGPLKDGCVSYVEANLQEIFDKLKHVDTESICHDLGFCPATKDNNNNNNNEEISNAIASNLVPVGILGGADDRPILEINDEDQNKKAVEKVAVVEENDGVVRIRKKPAKLHRVQVQRVETRVSIMKDETNKDTSSSSSSSSSSSLELPQMSCFTCKFVMGEGKRVLEEDSTIDQLTKLAESICGDLHQQDLKAQCSDFLSMYAKTYIRMAIDQVDPEKVCQVMGACEATPGPTPSSHSGNPLMCFGCQHGLEKLSEYWRQHQDLQTKALKALQSACLRLPDEKTIQECVDEVDVMFPVFSQLVANLDAKKACFNAGVCSAFTWKDKMF